MLLAPLCWRVCQSPSVIHPVCFSNIDRALPITDDRNAHRSCNSFRYTRVPEHSYKPVKILRGECPANRAEDVQVYALQLHQIPSCPTRVFSYR